MSNDADRCQCEFGSEAARIRCFVNHYATLQRQRGSVLTDGRIAELLASRSVRELRVDVIDCDSATEEIAQSLIVDSFLVEFCKRHPAFARESCLTNFKGKIDFFRTI